MTVRPGSVYLVGAGPGDPGLITVRGLELLQRADVILHDRLVDSTLLEHASPVAQLIDIGKTPWEPTTTQEEINVSLITYASKGKVVVRLKGGDPFVFGRGWEELEACRQAGIPCEVVPGVSSAIAGPAAAGIPVTVRGVASSVVVIAAQVVTDRQLDAAVNADTAVFLMGMRGLRELVKRLIGRGRDATTPAAVVERATLPGQRVVRAPLGNIATAVENAGIGSPAVIVVGETAGYGVSAGGPLSGRRVIVTRPLNAAHELNNGLRALGADVIPAPLIGIGVVSDNQPEVLSRVHEFDWIVFSSRHGVRGFRRALDRAGSDFRALSRARIAAVGPVTARELGAWGIRADLVANPARADVLVQQLLAHENAPKRVLFPSGTLALETIPAALGARGIEVVSLTVYETRKLPLETRVCEELVRGVDAVLFASPSAVTAFGESRATLGSARVVCIGPTTARAAAPFGWGDLRVADVHSDEGLLAATVAALDYDRRPA